MKVIRNNKKGEVSALQVIGGLILVLIVVFGLWWAYSSSLGEATSVYEGISVSSSRVAIDSCNAACAYINGDDVSGLATPFTGRGGAINSYCTEIKPFKDGSGKDISATCAAAVNKKELRINNCTTVC